MSMKDFQILNKLGEGAFSVVYKARRLSDGVEYALKKVLNSFITRLKGKNGTAVNKRARKCGQRGPYFSLNRVFLNVINNKSKSSQYNRVQRVIFRRQHKFAVYCDGIRRGRRPDGKNKHAY